MFAMPPSAARDSWRRPDFRSVRLFVGVRALESSLVGATPFYQTSFSFRRPTYPTVFKRSGIAQSASFRHSQQRHWPVNLAGEDSRGWEFAPKFFTSPTKLRDIEVTSISGGRK